MPKVGLKIKRMPRIGVPKFSRTETRSIGTAVQYAEIARIKAAEKPDLSSANPLAVHQTEIKNKKGEVQRVKVWGYAIRKQRKFGRNRRDETWTGAMLNSLRVTVAEAGRAVIKVASDQLTKATIRQNKDGFFGLSPKGESAGSRQAKYHWPKAVRRSNNAA